MKMKEQSGILITLKQEKITIFWHGNFLLLVREE